MSDNNLTYDANGVPIIPDDSDRIQAVVSGQVKTKKKGKVGRYLAGLAPAILALAGPTLKRFVWEAVGTALHMDNRTTANNSRGQDMVASPSYRAYYEDNTPSGLVQGRQYTGHDYNDVVFQTRGDAEKVLNDMRIILQRKKVVRLSQLYELCRLPHDYTDIPWGWAALPPEVKVVSTLNGWYKITLPPPMPISN